MSWRQAFKQHAPGERFGKLEIIRRLQREEVAAIRHTGLDGGHWLCRCTGCGKEKPVYGGNLRSGATKSCGYKPCRGAR